MNTHRLVASAAGLALVLTGLTAMAAPAGAEEPDPTSSASSEPADDPTTPPEEADAPEAPAPSEGAPEAAPQDAAQALCTFDQIVLSPDMTGDGRGEVVTMRSNGDVWAYPTSTAGVLGAGGRIASGKLGHQIFAPGDWSGDTLSDLITVDAAGDMFLILGTTNGSMTYKGKIGNGWTGYRVIPAGDLTGDGINDLLAIKPNGDLHLYAGNGSGGFRYPYPKVGNGWDGYDLYAAGDLTKDGKADILSVDTNGDLWLYRGTGNGRFLTRQKVGNGWGDYELAAGADLSGDKISDIVGRDNTTGILYFYGGKGSGLFATKKQAATGWNGSAACPAPVALAVTPLKDPILKRYNATGGSAKWGAATTWATCGLPDKGCIQEFAKGTVYATTGGVGGTTNVRGKAGRLIAVGESQVGYTAKGAYSVSNTKYNQWLNFGGPWCHMYQEWVADRAGLGSITGHYGPYFRYQNHLRSTMTQISGPRVGAYLFMSVSATYSHTGLITAVNSNGTFTILEGNWGHKVAKTTISKSARGPQQYWMPKY
jgi:hypothetical protein